VVIPAAKDNTIYEDAGGALSNGAGDHVFVQRNGENGGNRLMRTLIEFDVAAAIPAGSTITSATLTLNLSRTVPDFLPRTVALHRALAEWGEGSSDAIDGEGGGAPSTPGDATWIHTFYDTATWSSAGGDFVAAPSATTDVLGAGFYSWTGAQVASDVQLFLDQATDNHGWILIGDETAGGKRFDSRSNPGAGVQPALTVEFDPPSAIPAVPALSGAALGALAGLLALSATGSLRRRAP
jgi:hypothetical protein